jgi:hypothetical protein
MDQIFTRIFLAVILSGCDPTPERPLLGLCPDAY